MWEAGGERDGAALVAGADRGLLLEVMGAEARDVGRRGVAGSQRRDARLDQSARLEHLARLLNGRLRDMGAAVRLDDDDALVGERLERGANDRAAGAE